MSHVRLHDFRSYGRQELELGQGLDARRRPERRRQDEPARGDPSGHTGVLVSDAEGCRRRPFRGRRCPGGAAGLVREATPFATQITVGRGGTKQIELDGAAVRSHEELRRRLSVLVFTPDRLAVVKGSPAIRRRYLDRMISRLSPSKAALPAEYGAALAQRNAALRRVRAGLLERDAVGPWTDAVARLGDDLERARGETVAVIAPRFSEEAEGLGLAAADLRYPASEVTVDALEERLERMSSGERQASARICRTSS